MLDRFINAQQQREHIFSCKYCVRTALQPFSQHGKQQTFRLKMFRIENRFGFRKIGFRRIVFYLNIVDIPIYRFLSPFRSRLPVCHFTGIIRFLCVLGLC